MSEIKKAILVLFKDYKELRKWGNDYLLPIARRDDYSQFFDCHSDTHYKLGLMERSTTIGRSADDVYFVNCSIDDCNDEEFFRDLHVLKTWGTSVHYDPKDTEELQSKLKKLEMENQILQHCKKYIEEKGVILGEEIIENEDEVRYNVSYAPFPKPTMITVEINQTAYEKREE